MSRNDLLIPTIIQEMLLRDGEPNCILTKERKHPYGLNDSQKYTKTITVAGNPLGKNLYESKKRKC